MTIKDQLTTKFETRKEEIKRKKQEERIKNRIDNTEYKKLRERSKDLIDDTLTQIVLNAPFYDESKCICIKVKSFERVQEEQFILDNGYEINTKDIKRFCRKYKLKLKYQYKCNSKYGVTLMHTYRLYKGKQHFYEGAKGIEVEHFEAYIIGRK